MHDGQEFKEHEVAPRSRIKTQKPSKKAKELKEKPSLEIIIFGSPKFVVA
jgi:hypothetical protein